MFLQFFDQLAAIQSDSPVFLDLLTAMYRHFRVSEAEAVGRDAWPVRYQLPAAGSRDRATLTLGDQTLRLEPGEAGEGLAYEHTLYTLIGRVRSHVLVHAGAVAWQGRGLILAADAANGKTTLVLQLLRRGFSFLSDEMAALSRADGRLHAFPRALRLRPDTLARVGRPMPPNTRSWFGKLLVDIDDLAPGQLVDSADLAHVIFLSDAPGSARLDAGELSIQLEHADGTFMQQLRRLPDVTAVEVISTNGYPLLKIDTQHRMAALARIEQLCQAADIHLMDVIKRAETPASFVGPAALQPMPRSAAVIELLRRFQGGHHSALLEQDFGGQPTRLFQAVSRLIGDAQCHRLIVGALPQMADLVEALLDEPSSRNS
jgi:hypothetical protein